MTKANIPTSKSIKFPFTAIKCSRHMPSLEEWLGVSDEEMTDEMYDNNIDAYEDNFNQIYLDKTAIFNLEEWLDIDSFDHDDSCGKGVGRAFDKVYNKSYRIKMSAETWDEDYCYTNYADYGSLDIEADDKFYDDVGKINNEYVRNRVLAAFKNFLACEHDGLDNFKSNGWKYNLD